MKPHGCFNRQDFKPWHHAQDGYWPMSKDEAGTRLPRIVQIPHQMTTDCQYTKLNPTDQACKGCKHQTGEKA